MPVLVSGGLNTVTQAQRAFELTHADGVLLARGSLGNPWLFEQLLGRRVDEPTDSEILEELHWVMERAEEHLGAERAARYLRKFYPWYIERLSPEHVARLGGGAGLRAALQTAPTLAAAADLLDGVVLARAA